jgi:hypothetical protein
MTTTPGRRVIRREMTMNADRIMLEILALFLVLVPAGVYLALALADMRRALIRRAVRRQVIRNGMRQQAALDELEGR